MALGSVSGIEKGVWRDFTDECEFYDSYSYAKFETDGHLVSMMYYETSQSHSGGQQILKIPTEYLPVDMGITYPVMVDFGSTSRSSAVIYRTNGILELGSAPSSNTTLVFNITYFIK